MIKIWRAAARKASILFRFLRYPEQLLEVVNSRQDVKFAPLWEAISNRPEVSLAALIDPVTGGVYDYPSCFLRTKIQVADALATGIDYISASRVPGDVAEFGIGSGWTSAVLVRSFWPDQRRHLHLFDSFERLPEAGTIDQDSPMVKSGLWGKGDCNWNFSPEILTRLLKQEDPAAEFTIYQGWFSAVIGKFSEDTKLAMVHLDCDLYQSTIDVLDALFQRRLLSSGALLLFDDWTCNQCSPVFGQQRAWSEAISKYNVRYMDYGFYSNAGRRFVYIDH